MQKILPLLGRIGKYSLYGCMVQLVLINPLIAKPAILPDLSINTVTGYLPVIEQETTITGKVIDANGEPIPGATVMVEGTTTGVATDMDGEFTLTVPDNAVLVISFIGFETKRAAVGNQTNMTITLEESQASLEEVVVVGYGTQQKKEVTGSIAQVSGDEIRRSSAISTDNALAGRMPGLIVNQTNAEPGRDEARIFVRGQGTTGDNSALVVVDGVANRDGISRIDPNDIESITVLKDASAAIYGAQAANGVILITTKRGQAGEPTITYSANHGFVSPTRHIQLADGALYANSVNTWARQQGQPAIYSDQQIAGFQDGSIPTTNWIDEVYRPHSIQNRHSLTVSGGSEAVTYFLSLGTAFQDGLLRNDETTGFRQYNVRSNVDAQINENLKVGVDLSARKEDRNWLQYEDATIYSSTLRAAPDIPATINGLPARGRESLNPLAIAQGPGYLNLDRSVLNGTLRAAYQVPGVEGLSIDGWAAIDIFQDKRNHFFQQFDFYEDVNNDGNVLPVTGGPNLQNTFLRHDYNTQESVTLNGRIAYERKFGKHALAGFLAYEQNHTRFENFYAQRFRYESSQIDQLFAGSADTDFHRNNGGAQEFARQNYFGRVSYNYDEKYLLETHFRYDGSSRFPAHSRFGFFPGVSLGWRVSEEGFLRNSDIVSDLKLRGSMGKLGNDQVNPFQYLSLYSYAAPNQGYVFGGSDANILVPGVAANPNITWETVNTVNLGLDGGFFGNKLILELDVFREVRSDILGPRNLIVPHYTGLILPDENIREIENKGIEVLTNYRNQIGEFHFNIGGNFTYAQNRILFLDEGDIYPEEYQRLTGHPIGSQLAFDYIGIYRTQEDLDRYPGLNGVARLGDPIYRDVNGDGEVTNADRIRIDRNNIPNIQYGINLGGEFRGLDFSLLFQGQSDVHQYMRYAFSNGNNGPAYFLENAYDEVTNPNGTLPAFNRHNTQNFLSTLWLRDVSFLRLRDAEVGYTLPLELVSRIGLKSARVYVNGRNLLTFDRLKRDGLPDPESVNVEGWQFPHTKVLTLGVNVRL